MQKKKSRGKAEISKSKIASSRARAIDLCCEYLRNPLGIDVREPRLTWRMESTERGQKQTAYRIMAASTGRILASGNPDLWDSGKIDSDQSAHIPYAGKPLVSSQRCYWQVQIWDKDGRPTKLSPPAWWEMGLLEPEDWKGAWITWPQSNDEKQSPLFRKSFQVGKPVSRARLYICGIGLYEASINGKPVGTQALARQESVLPERLYYDTYDVTDMVKQEGNTIGVWLAPGWWEEEGTARGFSSITDREANIAAGVEPMLEKVLRTVSRQHKYLLMAQLVIGYKDGTVDWVVTDDRWKTTPGWLEPLSYFGSHYNYDGEIYMGERKQALSGWTTSSFHDAGWEQVLALKPPTARLQANMIEPNRVVEVAPVSAAPVFANRAWIKDYLLTTWTRDIGPDARDLFEKMGKSIRLPPAEFLGGIEYDFGKLVSGSVRLKVSGAKGSYISIYGLDTCCLSGEPDEELYLHSVSRVFRYVPVLFFGGGEAPKINAVMALDIHNDIRPVGRFECSDPMLTRIHNVSARTIAALISRGMPMESAREKLVRLVPVEDYLYNLDAGAFLTKWLTDHRDLQGANGYVWAGAPLSSEYAAWFPLKTALNILAPQVYLQYGDDAILKTNYPAMRRFVDYCFRREGKYSWQGPSGDGSYFGIWSRPGDEAVADIREGGGCYHLDPRIGDLADTLLIIEMLNITISAAVKLNEMEDVNRFNAWRERLTEKANRPEYFDRARGVYGAYEEYAGGKIGINGDMGCQALALVANVVPDEFRGKVAARLLQDIMVDRQGHLGTGFVGSYYLLKCLIKLNRPDIAYTLIGHPTAPSWAALVRRGDSMLPEFWKDTGTMGIPHAGLCCVGFWCYRALGGINPDPRAPGFAHVIIRPQIVRDLSWASVEYDSIRGTVKTHWTLEGERLKMTVTIPANVSARIYLPCRYRETMVAPQDETVRFVGMEDETAVFEAGSGIHGFESSLPPIQALPFAITPDIISPFKRKWRISHPIHYAPDPALAAPPELQWELVICKSDFVSFHAIHGACGGVAYAQGDINVPVAMKTVLLLGSDGPCKVWLDGVLVGEAFVNTNPAKPDTHQFLVTLTKGRHVVAVLFDRRGGRAEGFMLRFRRLVADATETELPVMDV